MTSLTYLVFDLESTGVRFDADHVLEIGAIAIDDDFNKIATYSALVCVPMSLVNEALDNQFKGGVQDTFVRDMHTKNGLLHDLAVSENFDLATQGTRRTQPAAAYADCAGQFTGWLVEQGYTPGNVVLVGHSIATFDVPMLKAKMPLIHNWLSHRTMDFGGIGRFLRKQCMAPIPETPKEEWPHRGLADCEIELAESQACIRMTSAAFAAAPPSELFRASRNLCFDSSRLDAPFIGDGAVTAVK